MKLLPRISHNNKIRSARQRHLWCIDLRFKNKKCIPLVFDAAFLYKKTGIPFIQNFTLKKEYLEINNGAIRLQLRRIIDSYIKEFRYWWNYYLDRYAASGVSFSETAFHIGGDIKGTPTDELNFCAVYQTKPDTFTHVLVNGQTIDISFPELLDQKKMEKLREGLTVLAGCIPYYQWTDTIFLLNKTKLEPDDDIWDGLYYPYDAVRWDLQHGEMTMKPFTVKNIYAPVGIWEE